MSYPHYEKMLRDERLRCSRMQEEFTRERNRRIELETEVKELRRQLADAGVTLVTRTG